MNSPGEPSALAPQEDAEATRLMPATGVRKPASQTLPTSSTASAGQVFHQVGRYRIVDRIGRGGMATVYKAHDPGINRPIAIKFLHANLCEESEYRERFLREARAAGGLSHPNIVIVHDVGEIEGRPYMAMELIDGIPLNELMRKGEPLPVRDVLEIGIQLARALDYAHSKGIVHRDIKPGNILRLRNTNTIKVTDFGIAHVSGGEQQHHTRVGDVIGTPQYMSPEQAMGHKIDGRSDLFSAGILLYQLLTGEQPFEGDSMVVVALKITREEPVPIDKRRADVPPVVRRVVDRCLAKSVDKRFQTGRELAEALIRALNELQEEQRLRERRRIIPLRVQWAGLMALIIAVVMAATATFISQRQSGVLLAQVTDYGASLARFVAAQNTLAVLGDEWIGVEASIQAISRTRDFQSIAVLDSQGVVRVSSDAAQVGQPYQPVAGESLGQREGQVSVRRYRQGGVGMFGFEAPMVFQDKPVGRIVLGLPDRPLVEAARYTRMLLLALVAVTVLAVAVAMYMLASWFARPIRLLGKSMDEIARGHYDQRIDDQRRDEFGNLYQSFDRMAEALQRRHHAEAPAVAAEPLRPEQLSVIRPLHQQATP